eukprot:353839-Chlamydomonas_euryale.AAC.56
MSAAMPRPAPGACCSCLEGTGWSRSAEALTCASSAVRGWPLGDSRVGLPDWPFANGHTNGRGGDGVHARRCSAGGCGAASGALWPRRCVPLGSVAVGSPGRYARSALPLACSCACPLARRYARLAVIRSAREPAAGTPATAGAGIAAAAAAAAAELAAPRPANPFWRPSCLHASAVQELKGPKPQGGASDDAAGAASSPRGTGIAAGHLSLPVRGDEPCPRTLRTTTNMRKARSK